MRDFTIFDNFKYYNDLVFTLWKIEIITDDKDLSDLCNKPYHESIIFLEKEYQ